MRTFHVARTALIARANSMISQSEVNIEGPWRLETMEGHAWE